MIDNKHSIPFNQTEIAEQLFFKVLRRIMQKRLILGKSSDNSIKKYYNEF